MRWSILKVISSLFLLCCGLTPACAQWVKQQQLTQNIYLHHLAQPAATLFVHFDKTIYTNNETVWFTGYLLKCNAKELAAHQVLAVALVRDADSLIVKQDKYTIDNGLSYGSMDLPDTLLTGNYHFQVTTNLVRKGIPAVSFVQPVIIKTKLEHPFNASLKLLGNRDTKDGSRNLLLSVISTESRLLPKPATVSYRYGNVFKKASTNTSGEVVFKLLEQPELSDPNVYAKIRYGKDSSFINIPFPVSRRKAKVRFYPEGGNLTDALPGYVAWEVQDQQLGMVALKAQLYKDDQLIDTIETNSYGIGKFILTPDIASRYTIRLMHSGFADSSYYLPQVKATGIGLSLRNAIAGDSLSITLRTKNAQKFALRVHDFRDTYVYKEMDIKQDRLNLKIPLTGIPKGLHTVTISDSLGRPLAERMFFAHYEPESKIALSTDRESYGQRQPISLTLKMTGKDTLGMVSVSCVQDNRLPAKLSTDIESYVYLKSELSALPLFAGNGGYEDQDYLNDVLLVKGWRRYTWQDIEQVTGADTLKNYDPLRMRITVNKFGKPVKKKVNIGFMKGKAISFGQTDETGIMELKREDLFAVAGDKVYVFVTDKNQSAYSIENEDPYLLLNKKYLKILRADQVSIPSAVQNNMELALKSNEKAISLKEVKITVGVNRDISYRNGANECGDYVCMYNILNCRNHMGDSYNKLPEVGRPYRDGLTGNTIVYAKCGGSTQSNVLHPIQGIYTSKEFYVNDFAQPLEPAFVSTLYWNHSLMLGTKEKEILFYTSDITGKFRIVVQGITDGDVIYGGHTFEVMAK